MALPPSTQLLTMNWSFQAKPFVCISTKAEINLLTMDYSFQATPFVSNSDAGTTPPTNPAMIIIWSS